MIKLNEGKLGEDEPDTIELDEDRLGLGFHGYPTHLIGEMERGGTLPIKGLRP